MCEDGLPWSFNSMGHSLHFQCAHLWSVEVAARLASVMLPGRALFPMIRTSSFVITSIVSTGQVSQSQFQNHCDCGNQNIQARRDQLRLCVRSYTGQNSTLLSRWSSPVISLWSQTGLWTVAVTSLLELPPHRHKLGFWQQVRQH
jgi:hypothetical protein